MNSKFPLLTILLIAVTFMLTGCSEDDLSEAEAAQDDSQVSEFSHESYKTDSVSLAGFSRETPEIEIKLPPAGEVASDFSLVDQNGKTVKLSELRGKIVVLEWFNYECPFSKYHYAQTSTMTDLANKYKDENVVWLAINSTKHQVAEQNLNFARNYNVEFAILDDRSGDVGRAYDAKKTPHMFIIDQNGYIAYEGAIDNAPRGRAVGTYTGYVDQALAELSSGKEVSIPETEPYGCTVKYGY